MLISDLCRYYDLLQREGRISADHYDTRHADYMIVITPEGNVDSIIDLHTKSDKGQDIPKIVELPHRPAVSKTYAYFIESRPLYLFGVDIGKRTKELTVTKKAKNSNNALKAEIDSIPDSLKSNSAMSAYINFVQKWDPEQHVHDSWLENIPKLMASEFVFCIKGHITEMIQDDLDIRKYWRDTGYIEMIDAEFAGEKCIDSITGKPGLIATKHDAIQGVKGKSVKPNPKIVSFNNACSDSYGQEKSRNARITVETMVKYTTALNYLTSINPTLEEINSSMVKVRHKTDIEPMTYVYWSDNDSAVPCDAMSMLLGTDYGISNDESEIVADIISRIRNGTLTNDEIEEAGINSEFHILALSTNDSRIMVKSYSCIPIIDLMKRIVEFQSSVKLSSIKRPISFSTIGRELVSPHTGKDSKTDDKSVPPVSAKFTQVINAVLNDMPYPEWLANQIIRRVQVDKVEDNKSDGKKADQKDKKAEKKKGHISEFDMSVRIGILKSYLIRNKKEKINEMGEMENKTVPYACGELFAVIEKAQKDANFDHHINATVRDKYFTAAMTAPASVYSNLLALSTTYIRKMRRNKQTAGYGISYDKMIESIVNDIGTFPAALNAKEQCEFCCGYYARRNAMYTAKEKTTDTKNEEKN